jgi:uncharacterized membrane protein
MFIMGKKGQGMSINVIIIAAIALIVLVVLAVLLFGATGDVTDAQSCEDGIYSGDCYPGNSCPDKTLRLFGGSCPTEQVCCKPL